MDAPTSLHKITSFYQLLNRLKNKTEALQFKIIKAAGEDDLRLMLLNRYPLKLTEMPETMASLVNEVERLLPDIKKIIERVNEGN